MLDIPKCPAELYDLCEYLLEYIVYVILNIDRHTDKHMQLKHFVMVVTSFQIYLFLYSTLFVILGLAGRQLSPPISIN